MYPFKSGYTGVELSFPNIHGNRAAANHSIHGSPFQLRCETAMKMKFASGGVTAQPDPFVCPIPGGWAMYVTNKNGIAAYQSVDPFGEWVYKGLVCKKDNCHEYWAPCMYEENGWYYLYFSCMPVGAEVANQWLHVARSRNPFGPFEEMKCLFDRFSIDAHVVRTAAGLYLWYAADRVDCDRVGTRIFVERMLDPMTPAGGPVEVVQPSFDQEIFQRDRYQPGQHWHTIEGPFWLQVGDWQYVMYSGACYENETYHIGYASAPAGQKDLTKVCFTKHTNNGQFDPLMTRNAVEEGVGHHSVICKDGVYYAVYHARDLTSDPEQKGDLRTARICKLCFDNGLIRTESVENGL